MEYLNHSMSKANRMSHEQVLANDWLEYIRKGCKPSCNMEQAFEEAITAHMGTIAYRENRKVLWDPDKKRII